MKSKLHWIHILVLSIAVLPHLPAQQQARVESFAPRGTVKKVRQVRVRFSEAMVPFGNPQANVAPFETECPAKGSERWADPRNWVYDFDEDLPAGVRCVFRLRAGLKSLSGNELVGERNFAFSTGGPAITSSRPYEGSTYIDEEQIFILWLDGDATEASVFANAGFAVEGVSNRIGVRIVSGAEKDAILKAEFRYMRELPRHLVFLQCKQRFPAGAKVSLVWGRGIASPTGVTTEQDQILPFVVRTPFAATFHCQRENPQADCIPITPMRISFSAPLRASMVEKALLAGPAEKRWLPKLQASDAEGDEKYITGVVFEGPFPERSSFTVNLPGGLADDSGRPLSNAGSFPLTVKTGEYPALAKFAAEFGILELNGDPLLPVTLRNVEPEISARMLEVEGGEGMVDPPVEKPDIPPVRGEIEGRMLKVPSDKVDQMLHWIGLVEQRGWEDRDKSVFGSLTAQRTRAFSIPKLHGSKAFEVIGIPVKSPGFYVVELRSELLGAALLGATKPMYVATTVLVTNLSVHFKWGAESSLVWVTTLDTAMPVSQAAVQVRDCEGTLLWEGKTDRTGLARIDGLAAQGKVPNCPGALSGNGLSVSAQLGEDMAFVSSNWNQGIEPWRFQLPMDYDGSPMVAAHSVLDRSLFRAGETVHMKHILRRRLTTGFSVPQAKDLPQKVVIQHLGSDQRYTVPDLHWDAQGLSESAWTIPKDAKLGEYQISLDRNSADEPMVFSGSFRVEEYRVPLMKAILRAPAEPQIAPVSVPLDVTVTYLSGGSAGDLPVRLRYEIRPTFGPSFDSFEGFVFSNGRVREGLFRGYEEAEPRARFEMKTVDLTLDHQGSVRATVADLPKVEKPMSVSAELEFRDPNGETQTVASRIPLWPAQWNVGLRPDSWTLSKDLLKFQVAVVDLSGKSVTGAPVKVDMFQRRYFSHRKRLVGGFYAYENGSEVKRLATVCDGKTDRRGLLICEKPSTFSGNLILQVEAQDPAGRPVSAYRDVWVAGSEDWWFEAEDGDRMDVLPESKRYEPGQKARLQVRMPFRKATALVTVEREGIADTFVRELSGKEPVIEIPVKGNYGPNVFVSVLALRGRVGAVQPTATVDLGRPAYKLGIAEITVGWRAYELKVKVTPDRPVYKAREKAAVSISVTTPEGAVPQPGGEVAVAAVDEGLLELKNNESWNLLQAMMARRPYGIQTATAQGQVIGKRHFGLKAMPQGGGGGRQPTRELFDTLLLWKGRVPLDRNGNAAVEVPLNDSLTSFRIVAVATAGQGRFGTGSTTIRSTQDLMILSGLAPVVRQGDRYRPVFTLRNAAERPMQVHVEARIKELAKQPDPVDVSLAPGESKEVSWEISVPANVDSLRYELEAGADDRVTDRLSVAQKVVPSVPVRTFQATLAQVDGQLQMEVERPATSIAGRGGVRVSLRQRLAEGLTGTREYMERYPYSCLEQEISRAVALRDKSRWGRIMAYLPSYVDSEGLAKYFPVSLTGSEVLTAYLISISDEAGWEIPQEMRQRMLAGLKGFVEGRVMRNSSLPTADLTIRKLAALEALSRAEKIAPALLSSLTIEPNLWPTSAVLDWLNILTRTEGIRNRDGRLAEADQIVRSRLNFQGTTMGFSSERTDFLWWLMVSTDANAVRLILSRLESPAWKEEMPRLVRGALGRQRQGRWMTTVANAWGVLAMEKFSKVFESIPVTGTTTASLAGRAQAVKWNSSPDGAAFSFDWPSGKSPLAIRGEGTGKPWATILSLAAIPLREPVSSGYKIRKTLIPVEQKERGVWSRGDVVRVRLEMESQSDMTWVVVSDPIPAGGAIFGTGLGRDSQLLRRGEDRRGWAWPAFEERSFEGYRAYYEFVPKGNWTVEYTARLNAEGSFELPPTRVEAMYAPEMFGEIPNEAFKVR
jgi:uncharacterized protein YfaS (alpha-2-macroglobulin family)